MVPSAAVRQGLYAIVDIDALSRAGHDPVAFARAVLSLGPLAALQLRAKPLGTREMLALARALAPLCRAAETPFYVNDRADVAALAGADGVHVGTSDLPIADVRRVFPGLLVGASSHTDAEVAEALAQAPDYLAFGPVFGTRSKADPSPTVGLDALREAVARTTRPVVAIGGITLENAESVRATGARAGAVIASLVVDDDRLAEHARALHRALGGH